MIVQFRYKFSRSRATAWVEIWKEKELLAKPAFTLGQLESAIAQLERHGTHHGNKRFRYPQTKYSLDPAVIQPHIDRLKGLLDALCSVDVGGSHLAVNLGPSAHREAGPAHGGPASASDTGAADQGFGSGMGGGGGAGGGMGP
jgi:hypothetical protein